jgi:hypothetical protein
LSSAEDVLQKLDLDRYVIPTDIPRVSLLKAGRYDES